MGDKDISVIEYVDNARLAYESVKNAFTIEFGVYNPAMKDKILGQASIANDMAKALANREFHIFVQPKVDHPSQKLIGGETLVRWFSPEPGHRLTRVSSSRSSRARASSPRSTNTSGRKRAKLLRKWIDEGQNPRGLYPPTSRGSISTIRISCLSYAASTKNTAFRKRFSNSRSPRAPTPKTPLQILESDQRAQHEEGFYLEMDDFGSGYSSLNMLKDAPVKLIKLDMKFFSHGNSEKGHAIIAKVVEMLKELDLAMIAEGVETKEQADFLSKPAAVSDVQGYLYSKPIPADDFEAYWLKMNGAPNHV
jgi:hypothetical protein